MRFGIYARFSSDLQRNTSIEDQVRLCRERIQELGGSLVEIYTDAAISGAHLRNRPGIMRLLEDARARRFDAVIAEALDRLSRDQEDIAHLHKRLSHFGVKIVTLAEGDDVGELHIGLRGTMNALYLKDLAQKTKRGQRGRVEAGYIPGGLTYGYDIVREFDARGEVVSGKRKINPEQAAIVRRIFTEYVNGKSPRQIAADLNREGVPSPRGGQWMASTINGNKTRRNGILHNELYIGQIIYNRQSFRKDPDSGKRVARPNPPKDWVVVEAPELRIIDDELWNKAKGLKERLAIQRRPENRRRPKHLFSGLVECGVCGGNYIAILPGRLGCFNRREKGTCTNGRTILIERLEKRVLDSLRERLLAPEQVAEFIREFQTEWKRRHIVNAQQRVETERRLREVEVKIKRIVATIEAEDAPPAALLSRLKELEAQRLELQDALAQTAAEPNVVQMHPNLAEMYRKEVETLQASLNQDPATRAEASRILRSMIHRIILHPGEGRGEVKIELQGRLAAILSLAGAKGSGEVIDVMKTMVAGAGFEPATFRL